MVSDWHDNDDPQEDQEDRWEPNGRMSRHTVELGFRQIARMREILSRAKKP